MTLYQKIMSVFGILRDAIELRATRRELASPFDPSVKYSKGQLVVYENTLYRCSVNHSGEWKSDDFVKTTVGEAIQSSGVAITGVTINGNPLTPENGVVSFSAVVGADIDGTYIPLDSNGVIRASVQWKLVDVDTNDCEILCDACNRIDMNDHEVGGQYQVRPPNDNGDCRQFALCINNIGGDGVGGMLFMDGRTGEPLLVEIKGDDGYFSSVDASLMIQNMAQGNSTIVIRFYEIYAGMFAIA